MKKGVMLRVLNTGYFWCNLFSDMVIRVNFCPFYRMKQNVSCFATQVHDMDKC